MSFKVEVNTYGDPEGVYTPNGLRFPTADKALDYGFDLACRWAAVQEWRVVESEEEPNR